MKTSLIGAGSVSHSPAGMFTTFVFTFQLLLLPASEGSIQTRHIQNFSSNRELLLGQSVNDNSKHQRSDDNSTCTSFSNYEELYSKCMSFVNKEKLNVLRNSINSSINGEFWCSCENHPCSLIYKVQDGSRIANVSLTGFVDNKAEIVILAEYASSKGEFFQIQSLRGYHEYTVGLERVTFDCPREIFLNVSTVNVTMVLNGGFSLIEDFKVIVEAKDEASLPTPTPEVITLDEEKDTSKYEWTEVTCHYGSFFEDFWTYGCPVNEDANFMPTSTGFWFPCHEPACSFTYDGTSHPKPTSVTISGYFQGGAIEIAGKDDILDPTPWKVLAVKEFHNTTLYEIRFNLRKNCDMKILQITLQAAKDSVVIVDKIDVHPDTRGIGSQCSMTEDDDGSIRDAHQEATLAVHGGSEVLKAQAESLFLTFLFLFVFK